MEQTVVMWASVIGLCITVFGGIVWIVRLIFRQAQELLVAPLSAQISILSEKIEMFSTVINGLRSDLIAIRERTSRLEASYSALHNRIDHIEELVADKLPPR